MPNPPAARQSQERNRAAPHNTPHKSIYVVRNINRRGRLPVLLQPPCRPDVRTDLATIPLQEHAGHHQPLLSEWKEVFPNAACVVSLIDRLTHYAEIIAIDGKSYRVKEARERNEQRARQRRGRKS